MSLSLELVGTSAQQNNLSGTNDTVDWPPGTQAGDWAVWVFTGAELQTDPLPDLGDEAPTVGGFHVATYSELLPDDFDIDTTPAPAPPYGEAGLPGVSLHFLYESINLAVYRNVAAVTSIITGGPHPGSPYSFPGGPVIGQPKAEAGVIVIMAAVGTVTGVPGNDEFGNWTRDRGIGQRLSSAIYSWDNPEGGKAYLPKGTFGIPGTAPNYWATVYTFDLTVEELVTRQYPRDDGLGLSSGPRIYPPPKARRIVGGYQ